MYAPILKRIKYLDNVLVERALPVKGFTSVKEGDVVEPFTRLGMAKVSFSKIMLPDKMKMTRGFSNKMFLTTKKEIGRVGFKKVLAPFDGYLTKESGVFIFQEEARDYWLLSGVWGQVASVVKDKSVLVKTQVIDVKMVACTKHNVSGELLVFPNPSDTLEMHYLEKFSKDVRGKIIYVGDFATKRLVKRAVELGVVGILAGGADKETFDLAKQNSLFLGIFTGYGSVYISGEIFDVLKGVFNRYVFLYGDEMILRIPNVNPNMVSTIATVEADKKKMEKSNKNGKETSNFGEVLKGQKVFIVQYPYLGWEGVIDSVNERSILVKFENKNDLIEVYLPDFLLLE